MLNFTKAEVQARREKGLCFHCDDKYSLGHRCKRELQIMIVHEDEHDEEDEGVTTIVVAHPSQESVEGVTETVKLSLNSVLGFDFARRHKDSCEIKAKRCYCLDKLWGNPQFCPWN